MDYPIKYVRPVFARDGRLLIQRPVHPEDGQRLLDIRHTFSEESVYGRFLGYVPTPTLEIMDRFYRLNFEEEMALVLEHFSEGERRIVAVSRLAKNENRAEFAIIIADAWQGQGLGRLLTKTMIDIGRDLQFKSVYGLVFANNIGMLEIFRQLDFEIKAEDPTIRRATLEL